MKKNITQHKAFLFGIAMIALIYGFGYSHILQRFTVTTIGALILGLCGLGFVAFSNQKKLGDGVALIFKGGTVKTLCKAVLALLIVITLNVVAFKFNVRWDVTSARQHTLLEGTQELLKTLDEDITLTTFIVGDAPKYIEDMYREYQRISNGRVDFEIVDPLVNISYASQFGKVINGKVKKVIVRKDTSTQREDVDFTDKLLTEAQLNNAIIRVTRAQQNVYFLVGHGENSIKDESDAGFSKFAGMLKDNNMKLHELFLETTGVVPDNCDALIIAGPREHLSPKEEQAIQTYLEQGGDALFLIEHVLVTSKANPLTTDQKTKNPSLNNILNQWGVKVHRDIVVDLDNYVGSDVASPATNNYMSHKSLIKDLDYTFYVRPRSITMLSQRRPTIKVAPFVLTKSQDRTKSWGEQNRYLEVKFDEYIDIPGPVIISFVIWEKAIEIDTSDTHIIVFTDADFLSNAYIESYSNARMGLNIIQWVAQLDYKTYLETKDIKIHKLDLTSEQKRSVAVVLTVIPLLIVLFGLMVAMRED